MNKQDFVNLVKRLKPGQSIDICIRELRNSILPYEHNGAIFYPPDQILENIVGSAYEFGYRENFRDMTVRFFRLSEPHPSDSLILSYISPDRRNR